MSRFFHQLRVVIRELRRRKVTSVVIGYVVAAAGVIQLADIVAPRLDMPENTVNMVILLALAGLPAAALLAWVYDLVPDAGDLPSAPVPALVDEPRAAPQPPLPTAATPFIGRAEELRTLCALLVGGRARLVTVTGPGGVGKTRLAREAAQQVAKTFSDGVFYRPLSGLTSSDLIMPALAETLGVPLTRREDAVAELQAFLAGKQLLIVLDNFEHVTGGAGMLTALLDHAPDVRMLVTSRERLSLQHETLLTLGGLPVDEDPAASHAVQLFVAGARRLERRFELNPANQEDIERICTLLDGIPLAIELASAWVRALSCAEIRAELERGLDILSSGSPDVEERHRSLRATFASSWSLLSPPEQRTLARLSVFRSEFDRAAAAEVAEAPTIVLRQLVDKSLLTRADDRLLMIDVVRAYALERLREDPAAERSALERHLAWIVSLLHSLQPALERADPDALTRASGVVDEIRAAWSYALESGNTGALLRAMDGVFHLYESRGWAGEGAEMFGRASAQLTGTAPDRASLRTTRLAAARVDVRQGVFLHRLGDLRAAEPLLRRGLAAARELEDSDETAFALHRLGAVSHGMGDYDESEQLHEEALAILRTRNDERGIGWSLTYLGNVAWSRGDYDRATQYYTDAMSILREQNDLNGMWVTVNNLGVLAATRQHFAEAQRRFREGLALQDRTGNPRLKAHVLHNLGCATREAGDAANARQWLRESLEISERMGYRSMVGLTLVGMAELEIRESNDPIALAALQRALRVAADARNYPLALEALLALARLKLRQGDDAEAAELATVVAHHPSADLDAQTNSKALLDEIGVRVDVPSHALDLNSIIARILGGEAAPIETARREIITSGRTAGDT